MDVRNWSGVSKIEAADWDRVAADAPPFVEHAFLAALEETRCVGDQTGWYPTPLTVHDDDGQLIGAAPVYIKTHSMGEFVYDWSWADAAMRFGTEYYPKVVIAAPFSPVPGPRLLVDPTLPLEQAATVKKLLLAASVQVARDNDCKGVHMLFCTDEERSLAEQLGFFHRLGSQLHWTNHAYGSFDDFLGRFKSKKRNQIRRERRKVRDAGIAVVNVEGDGLEDWMRPHAFRLYCRTVDRFFYGRRYLNQEFFDALWSTMRDRLQLVLAHREGDVRDVVAGAINMQKGGKRHGRYWGTYKDTDCLHFEVCSYASIEDCIANGLQVFEAGAGGYGHKYGRGFLPVYTHSVHAVFHHRFAAALADFCEREAEAVLSENDRLREGLFIR